MLLEQVLPWLGTFEGQVALVTGASSGIGRVTALMFGRRGARVALAARRKELLDGVASEIAKGGGRALVVPTDVGDARSARTAVARVRRAWGRVDILVNNAGVLVPSTVASLKAADLESMLRVNLFGALFMTQMVLPVMQRQESGVIINVASLAGRRGVSPLGGYCATKFGLVGLTEALRTEFGGSKLHVGLVMPGVVETPMVQGIDQDAILSEWPSLFNMPPEWIAAAVALAARFRLHEISVPPGAATLEVVAALAPGAADALIGWMRAAGRLIAAGTNRRSDLHRGRRRSSRTQRPRRGKSRNGKS
jgi:NAD(P)-dependent dehydrogenase (short-subunit alcohol dehydrogenase family)